MSTEGLAIKNIKYLAQTMKGLTELAESLGDATDLAQRKAELQASIKSLTEQLDELQRQALAQRKAISREREVMEQDRVVTVARSKEVDAAAKSQLEHAEILVRDAEAQASQIIQAAKEEGRAVMIREINAIKAKL